MKRLFCNECGEEGDIDALLTFNNGLVQPVGYTAIEIKVALADQHYCLPCLGKILKKDLTAVLNDIPF